MRVRRLVGDPVRTSSGLPADGHAVWERQLHDFQIAADVLPDARRAIAEVGRFVHGFTARPGRPSAASAVATAGFLRTTG